MSILRIPILCRYTTRQLCSLFVNVHNVPGQMHRSPGWNLGGYLRHLLWKRRKHKFCLHNWNQSTITSPDSLSKIRKYSRTNSPSLGCCVLCQSDWADYFTVILLIDQHVGVLKIKSLFCFLLISGKQVNLSTPLRSEPTWAVTGMNWQVFTLTDDSRKRSWSWSCVKWINLKVRNDDISRRKYASIVKLSAIFSQEVFVRKVMEK